VLFYGIGALYFKYRGVDGLGVGDAKLMFGLGLLVGPTGLTFLVLMASVSALATIIVFALGWWHKSEQLGQKGIAFGPFLCLPAWGLWLFQG
jgi:leader peptidase (prepilin peptidase)/N-methyltransferase